MTETEPILTRHEDGSITIQHPHEIQPFTTYRITPQVLDDIVDRLNRAVLAENLRTADRAQLRDERDRARSTAVTLEQQNERLLELLAQASTAIEEIERGGTLDAFSDDWRDEVEGLFLALPGPRDHDLAKAFAQTPTLDALLSEEANA